MSAIALQIDRYATGHHSRAYCLRVHRYTAGPGAHQYILSQTAQSLHRPVQRVLSLVVEIPAIFGFVFSIHTTIDARRSRPRCSKISGHSIPAALLPASGFGRRGAGCISPSFATDGSAAHHASVCLTHNIAMHSISMPYI